VAFVLVLTPANADIRATRAWFSEQLGQDHVALEVEGIVSAYDDQAMQGSARWTEAAYDTLHRSIVDGFADGEALRYDGLARRARDFVESLRQARPARSLGQKCGMDREDQLAVDLRGNVMTCQNTGARGIHRIGHVDDLDAVQLDTATHWSLRASCTRCPVVQLCKGGCMFLDGAHFEHSCENEYRFNVALLAGVLRSVTGLRLERITGDIRRPGMRRTIPIVTAST
jgi:uncharacterized protein